MTERKAGLLGRRPPKNARAIELTQILSGTVPAHPANQDNIKLGGWQMLGNDAAGDCVAVTWANFRRLVTQVLAGSEQYPTQDEVWAIYKTQNPGFVPGNGPHGYGTDDDQGMDIQTLLEYLVATGGPDGVKALAFAKVNVADLDEVKAALSIFGGLWTGITVQEENQTEFSEGKPWDWTNSPVEGGHSVLSGGYLGNAADDVTFITWAAETGFTDRFWAKGVEEAWAVIWPESLGTAAFQEGIDRAALAAAYQEITGAVFPGAPTPEPTPEPTPSPAPSPAPVAALPELVTEWLTQKHTGHTEKVAAALQQWVTDNNL